MNLVEFGIWNVECEWDPGGRHTFQHLANCTERGNTDVNR